MPSISAAKLGIPAGAEAGADQPVYRLDTGIPPCYGSDSLARNGSALVDCDELAIVDPSAHAVHVAISDDSSVKFTLDLPRKIRRRAARAELSDPDTARELFERDLALSFLAVEWYLENCRSMRKLTKSTVDGNGRRLRALFRHNVIRDPLLGERPPTLAELLRPDEGRVLIVAMRRELDDLGEVGNDMLRAARPFFRFIAEHSAVLPDGTNLRKAWGQLRCPLMDGDIPKRTPESGLLLPQPEDMASIYEASFEWAQRQRQRVAAMETAAMFVGACECGARGVELRRATLARQSFGRRGDVSTMRNPITLPTAKVEGESYRPAVVEPYGWHVTECWLREWRSDWCDDLEGPLYPSRTGSALSSGGFSERSRVLIAHLKSLRLVHDEFSFHSTRKTYATHYLERSGVDVDGLLRQCGWCSPQMLGVYVRPSVRAITRDESRFAATVGLRGGRR